MIGVPGPTVRVSAKPMIQAGMVFLAVALLTSSLVTFAAEPRCRWASARNKFAFSPYGEFTFSVHVKGVSYLLVAKLACRPQAYLPL